MANELVRATGIDANDGLEIVNPDTGEVYPSIAAAPTEVIAAVLGRYDLAITDELDRLRSIKRLLGDEMIERMDRLGEWTLGARGVKVSAPSPSAGTVSYDAEKLDQVLDELVAKGVIEQSAKLRAVSQKVSLQTHASGIAALLKMPNVCKYVLNCRVEQPAPIRRVTVKVDAGKM